MFNLKDLVHDVGNPLHLGYVSKVTKNHVEVHFMSGVSNPYTVRYAMKQAEKLLVKEV